MSTGRKVDFNRQLGDRLRKVRQQKGLSLLDVQAASGKEFKASVLGAYERGERALTVARLARLAEIYHVPLSALLPREHVREPAGDPAQQGVTVDAVKLREHGGGDYRGLANYVSALQEARGEWATHDVSIRGSDLSAIARLLGQSPAQLVSKLSELGLLRQDI